MIHILKQCIIHRKLVTRFYVRKLKISIKKQKIRAIGIKSRKKTDFWSFFRKVNQCAIAQVPTYGILLVYALILPKRSQRHCACGGQRRHYLCNAQVKKTPISSLESSKSALILAGTTTWAPQRRAGRRQVGSKGVPAGAGTYFLPMPQALGVGSSWCVSSPVF